MIRRFSANFQMMPKGASRPLDDGQAVDLATDDQGFLLLPSVGDFVHVDQSLKDGAVFSGRVRSRLFSYLGDIGLVNIVLEETDDDWGELIKE